MATNKFATMLHKNTHKIILILVYAMLEWILILLLLLNSLFSFLIHKFVKHFGLKPPCTYCSTITHLFESEKQTKSHQEHICQEHGNMISKLSYCSTHHRLNESNNLCFNCSFENDQKKNKDETMKCCCCDELLLSKSLHPFQLPFKDSSDFLDYIQKKTSVLEFIDRDTIEEPSRQGSECEKINLLDAQDWESCGKEHLFEHPLCNIDDETTLLENGEYMDSDRFICIELIDSDPVSVSVFDQKEAKRLEMEEMDQSSDSEKDTNILSLETKAVDLYVNECTNFAVSEDQDSNDKSKQVEKSRKDESFTAIEINDESLPTLDGLKLELQAQEKTLSALYIELEEERKASTKLHEEKSSMQMEALQYQRMMEEQAEYDQEALQLLNDLMIKREKEKQELEKELQVYREKVMEYEARDKMVTMRSKKGSFNSSTSSDSSHSKLNDEHQIDPNIPLKDFEEKQTEFFTQMTIPDISLAEFDEERLCILEELKALEAKLFTLPLDNSCVDMAKKLLPLFNATDNESQQEGEVETTYNDQFVKNEICIQDELQSMHERLQALEEDKEFLKHCMSSMMKGNKGLILLQEILQHLRDLRSVELSYNKCITE